MEECPMNILEGESEDEDLVGRPDIPVESEGNDDSTPPLNSEVNVASAASSCISKDPGVNDVSVARPDIQLVSEVTDGSAHHCIPKNLEVNVASAVSSCVSIDSEVNDDSVARPYTPMDSEVKKHNNKNRKSGRAKMGVGAFLQERKQTLATEFGPQEIDEDNSGNILIDGEPLSFESWGKWTQTSQPDVVSIRRQKEVATEIGVHELNRLRGKQRERRSFAQKVEMMKQVAEESRSEELVEDDKQLDDGEIVSEDEIKKRKRKRSSSSVSDTSSSGSSDGEGMHDSRKRRSIRRKQERKRRSSTPFLAQNSTLVKLFENRRSILAVIPHDQRTSFATLLRQMVASSKK